MYVPTFFFLFKPKNLNTSNKKRNSITIITKIINRLAPTLLTSKPFRFQIQTWNA